MIEVAKQRGQPLPEWYLNKPVGLPSDMFYLNAFNNLSTCRQIGMGLGPIPWDKIRDYALHVKLSPPIMDMFIQIIRYMDNAYLKEQSKKINLQSQKGKSKA